MSVTNVSEWVKGEKDLPSTDEHPYGMRGSLQDRCSAHNYCTQANGEFTAHAV